MIRTITLLAAAMAISACQSSGDTAQSVERFDAIKPGETVYFTGTEPFWGGQSDDDSLTYSTPENIGGVTFPIRRFAGNSGIGISGSMEGIAFDMTVTAGDCSDGMSDAVYPFTVTLRSGADQRQGCAWTDRQPRTNMEAM